MPWNSLMRRLKQIGSRQSLRYDIIAINTPETSVRRTRIPHQIFIKDSEFWYLVIRLPETESYAHEYFNCDTDIRYYSLDGWSYDWF